ncbi:MAG TPA: TIGR01244 family sulfur transferase [Vitreimonas sp.]|uniref:TIGR01244 family sulfur transferase n=1 Tax=Vitreimonas sp. TaxID=3069702 RepID=UPI002D4A56B0|nr:TIGR01244 family sulfur transferase [Vitreimonas sp.]HYD87998.1 TIGR01244 family sulfur transferase [Vitreimonas sp.]
MTEFRRVSPHFAVAGQIELADISRAAAEGYRTLVNNRPDGEAPGQPRAAEVKAAAHAAGLDFRSIAFVGPPPPGAVAETAELLDEAKGPVLAYCRSGKRSILAWALAEALRGGLKPDEIIALAAKAGYELEGARGALETLAPKT